MDVFLLSAMFASAVSLLLLIAEIRTTGEKIWARLGKRIRVVIARRTLNLIVVTVATLTMIGVLMIALGNLHPRESAVYRLADFLLGRRFASVLLGLLFGALFVFWMRQLLLLDPNDPKQQISWAHKAEAVLLVILLSLGAFSEVISSYARRITQFSAAGVSFTFEALKNSAGSNSGRGQQGTGAAALGGSSKTGSSLSAIAFFADIQGLIDRDQGYIRLLQSGAGADRAKTGVDAPIGASSSFTTSAQTAMLKGRIGSLGGCMAAVSAFGTDRSDVERGINVLLPVTRELVAYAGTAIDTPRATRAATVLVRLSGTFAAAVVHSHLRGFGNRTTTASSVWSGCQSLIGWWCPELGKLKDLPTGDVEQQWRALKCREPGEANVSSPDEAPLIESVAATLKEALADRNATARPYFSLLYASLLWSAGEYWLAARELENWLTLSSGKEGIAYSWYLVRVRTSLVVILEEWIRSTSNPPPLLLEAHLENVAKTIALMADFAPVQQAWQGFIEGGYKPRDDKFQSPPNWAEFTCKIAPGEAERISLALTYLSQYMVYAFRATKHRDYFDLYSASVLQKRDALLKINLGCFARAAGVQAADLYYAEMLQVCADIDIANAARIVETDAEAARTALENARSEALLGLQILEKAVKAKLAEVRGSVTDATTANKLFEVHEQLMRVRDQAQEGLRRT